MVGVLLILKLFRGFLISSPKAHARHIAKDVVLLSVERNEFGFEVNKFLLHHRSYSDIVVFGNGYIRDTYIAPPWARRASGMAVAAP